MPKLTLTFADGSTGEFEGTLDELDEIRRRHNASVQDQPVPDISQDSPLDPSYIAELILNGDESKAIKTVILESDSQINRALLPLYIVREYIDTEAELSAQDIVEVLKKLGHSIAETNIYKVFRDPAYKKYVMREDRDKAYFRMSFRGGSHFKGLLEGE